MTPPTKSGTKSEPQVSRWPDARYTCERCGIGMKDTGRRPRYARAGPRGCSDCRLVDPAFFLTEEWEPWVTWT
jgi:hypothetical protein